MKHFLPWMKPALIAAFAIAGISLAGSAAAVCTNLGKEVGNQFTFQLPHVRIIGNVEEVGGGADTLDLEQRNQYDGVRSLRIGCSVQLLFTSVHGGQYLH